MSTVTNLLVNRLDSECYWDEIIPHLITSAAHHRVVIITDKKLLVDALPLAIQAVYPDKSVQLVNTENPIHLNFLTGTANEMFLQFKTLNFFNPIPSPQAIETPTERFFNQIQETVMEYALTVLRAIHGDNVTLDELSSLLHNTSGSGSQTIKKYERKFFARNESEEVQKLKIVSWFLCDYFTGLLGERGATRTYEYASLSRYHLNQLIHDYQLIAFESPDPITETITSPDILLVDFSSLSSSNSKEIIAKRLLNSFNSEESELLSFVDLTGPVFHESGLESYLLNQNLSLSLFRHQPTDARSNAPFIYPATTFETQGFKSTPLSLELKQQLKSELQLKRQRPEPLKEVEGNEANKDNQKHSTLSEFDNNQDNWNEELSGFDLSFDLSVVPDTTRDTFEELSFFEEDDF